MKIFKQQQEEIRYQDTKKQNFLAYLKETAKYTGNLFER